MIQRDLDDHTDAVNAFRDHLRSFAGVLIDDRAHGAAGLLLVLDQQVYQLHNRFMIACAPPSPPAVVAAPSAKPAKERKRAPKGQGQHRHSFGSEGVCSCGAKRQRAPKGGAAPAERPSAEARTAPLPLGDHVPDRFDGGAFGSSSAGERSR